MPTYMHIDRTDVTAEKEDQVQFRRSKLEFSPEVKEIEKQLEQDPTNVELWMQKGKALSKQSLFVEAIEAYSMGLSYNPFHALTYRHRIAVMEKGSLLQVGEPQALFESRVLDQVFGVTGHCAGGQYYFTP